MADTHQLPFDYHHTASPGVHQENGLPFPMILLPPSHHPNYTLQSFLHAIVNHRGWIESHLQQSGALLFRGFPLKTASDFNEVVEAFGWEEQQYRAAASRTRVEGRVYTANEAPLHQPINFHHEMSMFEDFPAKLAFFCEVASPEGGETAVVLSHKITERMADKYPELVTKLEKEGLLYSTILPQKDDPDSFMVGWQTFFGTDDKEESQMKAATSELKWKVKWEGSNMILEMGPLVSIRTFDENRKKKAWFNNLAFNSITTFMLGDGSIFPQEAIESCLEIMEEECVEVKWEVGDVVVIDNRLVMHARRPSKPPRRVLAAFCK